MTERPWPLRPVPLEGESLTSWIARVAIDNGQPPRMYYVRGLGWQDVWNTDFDLFDDQEKLAYLAKKTDKSLDALMEMKLTDSIFPISFTGCLESHEFTHFCPACLAEGTSYFRKLWRSSQVVACEKHGTFLHARCGGCHAPVRLLARTDTIDLNFCSYCEHELGKGLEAVGAPHDLVQYSEALARTFMEDWFPLGGTRVTPQMLLAGLPALAEIVCQREVWQKVYADQGFERYFVQPFDLFFNRREAFADRCALQLVLSWILAEWPARFEWATSDLPDRSFQWMAKNEELPYWLGSVLKEIFDLPGTDYHDNAERAELIRLIANGTIDEKTFHKSFGRRHVVRINGRNLTSYKHIIQEVTKHAGT
ncbi:MAG: TniQ family protein [Desulfobacterales bacterium]